jgi:hypothetical protein
MKKELNMAARKIITKQMAQEYIRAKKKERGVILNNLIKITGYNRKYVGWLLRMLGKNKVMWIGKERMIYKMTHQEQKGTRIRHRIYEKDEIIALKKMENLLMNIY